MKAAVFTRYGPPDVVRIEERPRPTVGDGELVIRTRATTVGPADSAARSGTPTIGRLFFGLRGPKRQVLGSEFAGDVVEVGTGVDGFAIGDRVFGATGADFGAHAEYVRVPEHAAIVRMPDGLGYADAVAMVDGLLTALPFLRDHAKLRTGQRILVNGASGCVGIAAVQLAKHFGARVTGVCSGRNLEMVRAVGADHVVDYTREDFTRGRATYDVIFDAVGKRSFLQCRRVLTARGIYLTTAPSPLALAQMPLTALVGRKRAAVAFTGLRSEAEKRKDLELLLGLISSGVIFPVIDRRYPLERIADAYRLVDSGRKRGNIVITMESDLGTSPRSG